MKLDETKLLRMNLQLFADENGGSGADDADGNGSDDGGNEDDKPSYEELLVQLAKAKADADKWKRANDASSSQSAAWKKKYKERLDEKEAQSEEAKEAEALKDQELADLRKEVARNKSIKRFMQVYKMSEEDAEAMADLEADGELEEMDKKMQKHLDSLEKDAFQKAIQNRHDTHAGNGGTGETVAETLAKKLAKSNKEISTDILKNYIR